MSITNAVRAALAVAVLGLPMVAGCNDTDGTRAGDTGAPARGESATAGGPAVPNNSPGGGPAGTGGGPGTGNR